MSVDKSPTIQRRQVAYEDRRAALYNGIATFFTRQGGCSPSPRDSLDFSKGDDRDNEETAHNLKVASDFLGIDPSAVVMCRQRHSDTITIVSSPPVSMPIADAIIAEQPGVFPAIRTADCLPILVMDPATGVSAAIHAGWRGTALRVTTKVIHTLLHRYKITPERLLVVLGPAIGLCCYEVGAEVIDQITINSPTAIKYVASKKGENPGRGKGSFFVDLSAINRLELRECGIPAANIVSVSVCTSCRSDLFFSYRRDGAETGRQMSIVGFRR